jgi:hypothetical protein
MGLERTGSLEAAPEQEVIDRSRVPRIGEGRGTPPRERHQAGDHAEARAPTSIPFLRARWSGGSRQVRTSRASRVGIPPAWTRVWIWTLPEGHLQTTERDAKGRKQYRYHPRWREVPDQTKSSACSRSARRAPPDSRERRGDVEPRGQRGVRAAKSLVRTDHAHRMGRRLPHAALPISPSGARACGAGFLRVRCPPRRRQNP